MEFNYFGVIGMALIGAIFCLLVRKHNAEQALAITTGVVCIIGVYVLTNVTTVLAEMTEVARYVNLNYIDILYKSIGVSIVGQICADICNDYGQGSLANLALLAGRVAVLVLALPLFRELLDLSLGMVG